MEKGLASDRVVVETVVAKYADHLPLYRQAAILEREAGLEIGRATLDGWVMRVGELLEPVVAAMRQDLLRGLVPASRRDDRAGADARQTGSGSSGVPMAIRQAGWRDGIRFPPGARTRGSAESSWGQWEGILQTDGYQAYDGIGGPKLVHVGCWAHARRKFVDAVKVNRDDAAAVQMVMRMDGLFLVDRDAREKQMTVEERLAARRQHARGLGGRDSAGMREARRRPCCRRARWAKRSATR